MREADGEVVGSEILEHAGSTAAVGKVTLPSPTGRAAEAIPDRRQGSFESSKIGVGLADIVEEGCLGEVG